jgi:hypothetical protein
MAGTEKVAQGRLAGAKAQSYLRAVNEPEARASQFTARLMLVTDLAYLLCSAEAKLMPRVCDEAPLKKDGNEADGSVANSA